MQEKKCNLFSFVPIVQTLQQVYYLLWVEVEEDIIGSTLISTVY